MSRSNEASFDAPLDLAEEAAEKTWAILNDLKPYLWRAGKTFPASINALQQLFANREVALYFSDDPASFGTAAESGTFPPTVRSCGLRDGTIGNTHYTLIPFNSPNKAAALVLQNLPLSGEIQFEKTRPEVWGATPAIKVSRTAPEVQAQFAALVQPRRGRPCRTSSWRPRLAAKNAATISVSIG